LEKTSALKQVFIMKTLCEHFSTVETVGQPQVKRGDKIKQMSFLHSHFKSLSIIQNDSEIRNNTDDIG